MTYASNFCLRLRTSKKDKLNSKEFCNEVQCLYRLYVITSKYRKPFESKHVCCFKKKPIPFFQQHISLLMLIQ